MDKVTSAYESIVADIRREAAAAGVTANSRTIGLRRNSRALRLIGELRGAARGSVPAYRFARYGVTYDDLNVAARAGLVVLIASRLSAVIRRRAVRAGDPIPLAVLDGVYIKKEESNGL